MQKFELFLRNEKISRYRLICLLVVISNCLLFFALIFNAALKKSGTIALILIAGYTIYRLYISYKKKLTFYFDEWVLFFIMILWVIENNYLFAVANLILFLLYSMATDITTYEFNPEWIRQRNFPWKKYTWQQLTNVVLKDNILTMDFKSNKLLQQPVNNEDINEDDFNQFARAQLRNSSIK